MSLTTVALWALSLVPGSVLAIKSAAVWREGSRILDEAASILKQVNELHAEAEARLFRLDTLIAETKTLHDL